MRRFVWVLLLLVPACREQVEGELRLSRPVTTTTAVAHAALWEYDPQIADGAADLLARFAVPVQQGVQAVPFVLDPDDGDSSLSHYVTANVDIVDDGDGDTDDAIEDGDFVVTDFHKVDLGASGVIIPLTPLPLPR